MSPERELISVAKRWDAGRKRFDQLTVERDQAIRAARAAGISQRRVMEITGLSRPRLNQIIRDSRV